MFAICKVRFHFSFYVRSVINIVPMQRTDYLLDINTEMRRAGLNFVLMFQRIVWQRAVTYENEILVKILFHQVFKELSGFFSGNFQYRNVGLKFCSIN